MARRKKDVDEGYSSDSASSSSSYSHGRKRKRNGNKEDAIYGIFGSGSEGENERQGGSGKSVKAKDYKGRRVDFLKGQSFVAASSSGQQSDMKDGTESDEGGLDESSSDEENGEISETERIAKEPATELEELETRNPFAQGPTREAAAALEQQNDPDGFRPSSFVSSRGGIGSAGVPTSFGSPAPSSAFAQRKSQGLGANKTASFITPATSIKFGGGFGGKFDPSKYLAQMGWTGGGLGKQGEGIVNPIEVKQRPERAGIAFGGIKEKTKQAKEEARRRGEEVSTDEDEREKRKKSERHKQKTKSKEAKGPKAWTQTEKKPRKPKIEHRTYEQILEEHGHSAGTQAGVGQIIDAAGNEFSSLSAALAKHTVPSNESTQLVEIRHNLRLICDGNQTTLQSLAKEGSDIQEKHKWLMRDRDESQRRVLGEELETKRLKGVLDLVLQIEKLGKESQTNSDLGLSSFDGFVNRILAEYKGAIGEFRLDEAIVGAIVPTLRKQWTQWEPLKEPELVTNHLHKWKDALRVDFESDIMTPYESLLWNLWMPPVRSALNNSWNAYKPSAAVALYQAWIKLLPPFIADNLTQQLIIPKLSQAVADWDTKAPLHRAIFPWMALLSERVDDVVSDAKRRVRSSLKSWKVSKGMPVDLGKWKEAKVFSTNEWNSMLLDHIVPKLSSYLDANLVIDPQAQDTRPLESLLAWKSLLAPKIMSKVLFAKFVPKWLNTLHAWLIDSRANLEEVAQWYENWKSWFGKQDLLQVGSLREGFQVALQLMSQAIEMGSDRSRLAPPNLKTMQAAVSAADDPSKIAKVSNIQSSIPMGVAEESSASSFRKVVEEAMMEADLIMQSLNRKEIKSGMPLYRISRNLDGKGGVTLYLDEDVIFIERREEGVTTYDPVSIKDLVKQVA